MTKSFKY
jgi:hypothetical protein